MVCLLLLIDPHLPQLGSTRWRACHALARLALTPCDRSDAPAAILTCGRFSCFCTPQYRLISEPTPPAQPTPGHMQKDRHQKLKVGPRTAIERAPSLTLRLLIPMLTPS
jgi:hypothetical protein